MASIYDSDAHEFLLTYTKYVLKVTSVMFFVIIIHIFMTYFFMILPAVKSTFGLGSTMKKSFTRTYHVVVEKALKLAPSVETNSSGLTKQSVQVTKTGESLNQMQTRNMFD